MDTLSVTTGDVWGEFGDRLRRFILKRVRDEADAEDILQDVLLKVHSNIASLKQESKLASWVFQIARNAIVDYYRRKKVAIDLSQVEDRAIDPPLFGEMADDLVAGLRPMIDQLPPKYRQAIMLTEYEELTQGEMARRLGLSLSGAKSRVQRARGKLKDMLLECCHFEFDRLGNIIDYHPIEKDCRFCSTGPTRES